MNLGGARLRIRASLSFSQRESLPFFESADKAQHRTYWPNLDGRSLSTRTRRAQRALRAAKQSGGLFPESPQCHPRMCRPCLLAAGGSPVGCRLRSMTYLLPQPSLSDCSEALRPYPFGGISSASTALASRFIATVRSISSTSMNPVT